MLRKPGLPLQLHMVTAARDVVAIIKGIVHASAQRGEKQSELLARRVQRAVFNIYTLDGRPIRIASSQDDLRTPLEHFVGPLTFTQPKSFWYRFGTGF